MSAPSAGPAPAAAAPEASGSAAYAANLSRKIWRTRGARLNAYRRLTGANEWSLRALAFLSVYAVCASLALTVPALGLSGAQKEAMGVALNGLSVFLLVLSLLEAPRNYQLRADRLHRCAVELGDLSNAVDLEIAAGAPERLPAALARFNEAYAAAIARCAENHEPLDDAQFRAEHPGTFPMSRWERFKVRHLSGHRPYLLYYAFVWAPPLAAAAVLAYSR